MNTSLTNISEVHNNDTESLETFQYYTEGISILLVGIIGIIGNIASIIVFLRSETQKTFHRLMISCAVVDTFYLALMILVFSVRQFSMHIYMDFIMYLIPVFLPLLHVSMTGSVYCTMSITLERFLTVCAPFFHFDHRISWRFYVIPIFLFSFGYNTPKFFEMFVAMEEVRSLSENSSEVTYMPRLNSTELRRDPLYVLIYINSLNLIVMTIIPYIFLLYLNFRIYFTLCRFHEQSDLPMEQRRQEQTMSRVTIAIVGVFITCQSVKIGPNIYEMIQRIDSNNHPWPAFMEKIIYISHVLMTFNASSNPFIYHFKHRIKKCNWHKCFEGVEILPKLESCLVYTRDIFWKRRDNSRGYVAASTADNFVASENADHRIGEEYRSVNTSPPRNTTISANTNSVSLSASPLNCKNSAPASDTLV